MTEFSNKAATIRAAFTKLAEENPRPTFLRDTYVLVTELPALALAQIYDAMDVAITNSKREA